MDSYSVVTSGLHGPEPEDARCLECRMAGLSVWCPECTPVTDRELGEATMLTKAERRYAETPPDGQTRKPPPSLTTQLHRAVDNYIDHAQTVATELKRASVSAPPPKLATLGQRRGSDHSDPALAQITATHDAIDRGLTRYGHLLDDCLLCGPQAPRPCNDDRSDTLARLVDDDWTEIADHLTGLSATSPRAVESAVDRACDMHEGGAERFKEWWKQLRLDGAETDVLSNLVNRMGRMAARMHGLAESMRQWDPEQVRKCACGCGAHAPTGRRVTEACRKREERAG